MWALVPAPAVRRQKEIATCACASQLPPSRCGGAAPAPLQLAYQLPAGITFRGKLAIEYAFDVVSISYADYRNGSGCPPMPPPPP